MAFMIHEKITNLYVLEHLLDRGLDPNHLNHKGESALVYAANYRQPHKVFEILIEKGAIVIP